MRIRALQPVKAYWNYQVHELAEGDIVKGGLAEHLADDPRVEVLDQPAETPAGDGELDITGTVDEVLAWVGDDPGRAAEAHAAEQAKDTPRSTLLAKLAKLAEIIDPD
ncbi:hypothetical protein ACIBH1_05505 [Nonomuraea sp. NPDC050663]|uniref:hypothetical protein n=1 Tax=Nonomuraea sp. NPDC050663 TaxID=3364370 RepID=UPI0037B2D232